MSKTEEQDRYRVKSLVGAGEMTEDVLARSTMHADYVDHFFVDVAVAATPERWARAMFGDVPTAAERFIWQGLLQLKLIGGWTPTSVAGWRIAEATSQWIRLETRSHSLTVHLVIHAANGRLELTTFVRYDRGLGRWVWVPLSAVHRRLAPSVLTDAISRLGSRATPRV
ncbi:hypothetical protein CH251_02910 [Rhodococcus sp. 06-462-5]|uniref:hypothetical protein n=1 Tax=unclassified Rhodococcus (in: high G+C Gram-positive bacteria) TaxID=192944 RepID=UPI000B9A49F9|nr:MULTISPECIES: hypothetical protein [unclassified Rhodococcus (in: high G+C Gram-positive bacteria)]OZC78709.1 hypothetical protein CH251_02910 [Rhodococcus sp. 06-462-5]OZE62017.1 hypothetical protein CH270_20265 [Rhodococcus sp. 02-925g]